MARRRRRRNRPRWGVLSEPQSRLLNEVMTAESGYVFIRAGQLRTADSLERRGLIETSTRDVNTGERTVAYRGNWGWTAERRGRT